MKRFSLGFLAAMAMLVAVPSGVGAAVTIGETGVPNRACNPDANAAQAETAGPPGYAVPAGFGVITSWSIRASGAGKLVAWRPTAAPDQFIVVGKSGAETWDPDAVRTFLTRIPVQPNDVLGLRITGDGQCLFETGVEGDTVRFNETASDPLDGSTQTLDNEITLERLLVAASVEPDCDKDGFGDETQDGNTAPCLPLTCKGEQLTMVGTPGNDEIVGTANRDVIAALDGNDKVLALDGDDIVCGNRGKDRLLGQDGEDVLKGNRGKDSVKGGSDDDRLKGNRGADLLKGKGGEDFLGGGKGNDTCRGGKGDDKQKSC